MSIMAKTPSGYKKIGSAYLGERPVDKVFNANGDVVYALQRELTGVPPLLFKGKELSELLNYRIYGDTVDGESVGDRTANLFDMKKFAELCSPRYASVTFADNTLSFTSTAVDAYVNYVFGKGDTVVNEYRPSCIDVLPSTTYTISMSSVPKCYISWINSSFKAVSAYTRMPNNQSSYTFTTPENCTKLLFRFGKEVTNIGDTFTISNVMLNAGSTPLPYEPYGYKVPVTVEGKNLFDENAEVTNKYVGSNGEEANSSNGDMLIVNEIAVKPDTTYTFSWQRIVLGTNNNPPYIRVSSYDSNNNFLVRDLIQTNNYPNKVCSITTPNSTAFLDIRVDDISSERGQGLEGLMLNVGSTPLPYEPYHTPVTTPIYLPEPIKMVGSEAEYIDYAEQKMHRIGADDIDVTLPALPTIKDTNTMSIDTTVQPSRMDIKGRIKTLT